MTDSIDTKPGAARAPARHWTLLRRPLPIGAMLGILVAVALFPTLIFTMVLLERNDRAQQEVLTTLAEATAGSIAETIDRELLGMGTTLRVLSTARSLQTGDFASFYSRASIALEETNSYFILLDDQMNQLMNTRVPFGTPLGQTADPGPARYALARQQMTVSNGFIGSVSQQWVFNVLLPTVQDGRDLVMVLTKNAEDINRLIAGQNLRGGWNASIVDANGIVLASSFMASDTGKPFFLQREAEPSQRMRATVVHDGRSYETIKMRSPLSGWDVVVWSATEIVEAPMRRAWQIFATGGLLLSALSVLAAVLIARRISRPVRALVTDARRLGAGEPVEEKPGGITEIQTVSAALAQASRDRRASDTEIRFLMREVAHRSKNQLTVVSSIAKQTARHSPDFAAFQDAFQKRVQGLARSTDLLIAGGVAGVELRELLEAQIEPFRPGDEKRIEMSGPRFRLSNQAAQTLGLAMHELATNASKYGAFHQAAGRLVVTWRQKDGALELVWREFAAMPPQKEERRGFGTEIIERMVGGTLDAEIARILHEDGLEWRFAMPVEKIAPEADDAGLRAASGQRA